MDRDINNLLEELNKETGLHLEIAGGEVDEDTSLRLQELLLSVKDHTRRDLFWQNLLLGQLSREEAVLLARRFHIDMSAPRVLFLVAFFDTVNDITVSVLKTIVGGRDELVTMDDRHIAVIKSISDDDIAGEAMSLSDMIASEAMVSARIAYDKPAEDIYMMSKSFLNCEAALKVSSLLSGGSNVVNCDKLCFEKLLSTINEEAAKSFLSETVPGLDLSSLDNEMKNTISTLFENELNLADTAKALFIHRNTLVYRLEKFYRQTGLDLKRFDDAVICRTALILSGLYGFK